MIGRVKKRGHGGGVQGLSGRLSLPLSIGRHLPAHLSCAAAVTVQFPPMFLVCATQIRLNSPVFLLSYAEYKALRSFSRPSFEHPEPRTS